MCVFQLPYLSVFLQKSHFISLPHFFLHLSLSFLHPFLLYSFPSLQWRSKRPLTLITECITNTGHVYLCVCVCVREREIDTSSLFLQNEFSLYMDENLLTFHDEGLVFCLFHKLYSSLKGFYGSCNSDERNLGSRLLLHLWHPIRIGLIMMYY